MMVMPFMPFASSISPKRPIVVGPGEPLNSTSDQEPITPGSYCHCVTKTFSGLSGGPDLGMHASGKVMFTWRYVFADWN